MRLTPTLAMLTLLCAGSWARADSARHDLRVELGTEYDSNPDRAEQVANFAPTLSPAGPSPLARLVASGNWASALGHGGALALSGAVAGKRFFDQAARGDDVLIAQAGANGNLRIAGRTILGLASSYYDAFQRGPVDPRDFRSLAPTLRIEQGFAQAAQLTLGGGYRWFTFKSDDNFSFAGATAFLTARQMFPGNLERGGADWEWTAGASLEWRGFDGLACTNETCTPASSSPPDRVDRFWIGHVELTRTTTFLLGAGAALHLNQSNSRGEALVRGVFHLRTVMPLPWQLSLSSRADLVATHYQTSVLLAAQDPNAGAPLVSIEDENRSTLRIEVARPLAQGFEIGARYVLYSSFPGRGSVDYRRQTALLYLAVFDER
ncbi:MAG TPA: hypothetical protein VJ801_02495 [Polyangia bacterium]|jgi:hypothetical protein|nr:hypothetical protein [Polyangia bacterium]